MSSEDWKFSREEEKKRKQDRQKTNREKVDEMTIERGLDVRVIAEHHLRIELAGKKLDYFPQSSKACWVGSGKWFKIDNIQKFIREQLKTK